MRPAIHANSMENTPPPVPPPSSQSPAIPPSPSADNSLAVVMQLLGFAWFVIPFFGNILAPLILWLVKRSESPYLDRIGKEVLNFQISYTIYMAVGVILCVLPGLVAWVLWIVLMITAAVKTSNGEEYKYPFTIRLLQ